MSQRIRRINFHGDAVRVEIRGKKSIHVWPSRKYQILEIIDPVLLCIGVRREAKKNANRRQIVVVVNETLHALQIHCLISINHPRLCHFHCDGVNRKPEIRTRD